MCAFGRQIVLCSAAGIAAAIAVAADHGAPASAAPSLRHVLARAADYSVSYGAALASVIADEDFVQELVLQRNGTILEQRRLESEIAFVKLADTIEWLAFRSVLRVDGVPVTGTAGQLERVFRDTPRSALAQARAITRESARFNLGPVERNFNVPTTVLQFILPQHQERFRFRKTAEERVGEEVIWIVEYREQSRSTFIRTPQGRDVPAHGQLWIAPDTGRVARSRLVVNADVQAEIDVVWQHDGKLTLWVPAEMREAYRGPKMPATGTSTTPDSYDVRGVARYSNYRRFEVDFRIVR